MCKGSNRGDFVRLDVPVSAEDSHTGKPYTKNTPIDACIAPIVKALLDAGIETRGCCCGHGKRDGTIWLADGREIVIRDGTGGGDGND